MKTPDQITQLNYNDVAFLFGMTTTEAKWKLAVFVYSTHDLNKNLTKTGVPKISKDDYINKDLLDLLIRSNSKLDGQSQCDTVITFYNKGTTMEQLKEFSITEALSKQGNSPASILF